MKFFKTNYSFPENFKFLLKKKKKKRFKYFISFDKTNQIELLIKLFNHSKFFDTEIILKLCYLYKNKISVPSRE